MLTNLQASVYPLDFVAGTTHNSLPDYIRRSKTIIGLDTDGCGVPYADNLCAFRCLAYHRHGDRFREGQVQIFFKEWLVFSHTKLSSFRGISFEDLPEFEECFKLNVMVYCLAENNQAASLYRSPSLYQDTLHLNLFDQHFSYIQNINGYCKRFRCSFCGKLFKALFEMHKHQTNCTSKSKYRFPGGFYAENGSIFDEAETIGIHVPQDQRFNPYVITYDMEARMSEIGGDNGYISEHIPISVAIASTVPGYENVKFLVNENSDTLIKDMAEYMTEVATNAEIHLRDKWRCVFSKVKAMLDLWKPDSARDDIDCDEDNCPELIDILEGGEYGDEEDDEGKDVSAFSPANIHEISEKVKRSMYRRLKNFESKFERFVMQIPSLGFNNSFYDHNIAIQYLIRHFNLTNKKVKIVKRNNRYMCLSTEHFRFLDIMQYLPQNTSYSQFLKAFQIPEAKGHFPFEYINTFDKLHETQLPPIGDAWFSAVRGGSVLDDGEDTIENNFKAAQDVWKQENMETILDYLRWYNANDCLPLLHGVEKVRKYYAQKGICVFTSTISVSGCARKLLFSAGQQAGGSFAVFDKQNKDLYATFKQGITGGPSECATRITYVIIQYSFMILMIVYSLI